MVYHDRKRARGRPSIHNEGTDLPPPPPPKRPSMCVKVKHHLIPRTTLDILLHGWKVKLEDGKYAKTWITDQRSVDQITPPYIPDKFDILGEKLDRAFINVDINFTSPSLTSFTNDLMIDHTDKFVSVENYTLPSETSLELRPLFSQDEASLPPPPPPPPPSAPEPTMEPIGDQLENSQYSPTHTMQYEEDMDIVQNEDDMDTGYSPSHPTQDKIPSARGQHKTSESSSDYLSADEDFPPPAPSPPSIPNTPSPAVSPAAPSTPDRPDVHDDVTLTASSLQEPPSSVVRRSLLEPPDDTLSSSFKSQRTPDRRNIRRSAGTLSQIRRTPSKLQTTPSKVLKTPSKSKDSHEMGGPSGTIPQPMDVEEEEEMPIKVCPESDDKDVNELQDADEGQEEAAEELGPKVMGNDVEDIDSPDELEEEDLLEPDEDPTRPPSQISLFREIITDSGEIKRVLYFRKSKFRATGTALHQISKMSSKMDYEDACKDLGFPELLNKTPRPADLGKTLSDRIEKPKKVLPVNRTHKREFGVPLANLTRSIKTQHSVSTAVKMKHFGIPLRQVRGPLLGSHPSASRPMGVMRSVTNFNNARPSCNTLTRSEQLISEFCACWVQRPFHDQRCASMHDNFVEVIMKRHGAKYAVIKDCIKEYSTKIRMDITDPVRAFNLFKSIMKNKT